MHTAKRVSRHTADTPRSYCDFRLRKLLKKYQRNHSHSQVFDLRFTDESKSPERKQNQSKEPHAVEGEEAEAPLQVSDDIAGNALEKVKEAYHDNPRALVS